MDRTPQAGRSARVNRIDCAIVGGGIVGLATAWTLLQKQPGHAITVFEKEKAVAQHQTSHNSGVIHSGLYYKPGSEKARTCVEGSRRMLAFCKEHAIPHNVCGKLVIASNEAELPALAELHRRAQANGVATREIGPAEMREIEPHCVGVKALHVPGAAIVSYAVVAQKMTELLRSAGGTIELDALVVAIHRENDGWRVVTLRGDYFAKTLINCGGLFSDRIAALAGAKPTVRIVPFRGEYYQLRPERASLVCGLIYPVPDPRFPFLGVHFTRRINGSVECGPNAVLALRREGYTRSSFHLRDAAGTFAYPGFWKLSMKYWKTGLAEFQRSFSKKSFTRALQKLVPEVRSEDLIGYGSGVRAQALQPDGTLVDDFRIVKDKNTVHVLNAPSPAATASFSIAEIIVNQLDS